MFLGGALLRTLIAAVAMALLAGAGAAQDYVITPKGKLSDRDFYRLVSCGAAPGGKCRVPAARWSKADATNLTLSIVSVQRGFPVRQEKAIRSAVARAINELNGVGAGVHLSLVSGGRADMEIHLVTKTLKSVLPQARSIQEEIVTTGAIAMVRVHRQGSRITKATVLYTSDIPSRMTKATVLEEIVQGLGLPFDIHNKAYYKSLFSETDCCQTRLKGQDAKAILYHYPPG